MVDTVPQKTKTLFRTKLLRIFTLLVALAAGVGIVGYFVSKKQPPQRIALSEVSRDVQVISAARVPFVISATGFGAARPEKTWSAISNVKGPVTFRRPDLESGAVFPAGTLLLKVDPGLYELALLEAEAEIASADAEIAQLKQENENSAALLDLERQRLELAEAALERIRALLASDAVSQASLETQLRATLQQRQAVQSLVNQQNIFPIQLQRLQAQKERANAKRAQVQSDLADTKIYAPFDLRISEVNVEEFQYINPGQLLFAADGTKASEITLQVPMQALRRVLEQMPANEGELDVSGLAVEIQLIDKSQSWDAQVLRIANGIDPATRTVQVVARVMQPDSTASFTQTPPLPKGMYVQGLLRIAADAPLLVIPQETVHTGEVYIVNAEQRLERRAVEISFRQDGLAIVQSGIEEGEKIVLDDIVPAISGMLLAPAMAADKQAEIRAAALGDAL